MVVAIFLVSLKTNIFLSIIHYLYDVIVTFSYHENNV